MLGFFAAFLFLILAPGFLPQEWLFAKVLNQVGVVGVVITLIVLLSWIYSAAEKQPMLDFPQNGSQRDQLGYCNYYGDYYALYHHFDFRCHRH